MKVSSTKKQLISLTTSAALLLGGITTIYGNPSSVEAATQYDEARIVSAVNFRTAPSLESGTYGTLQTGTNVKILEEVNRYWLKVEAKGKIGYISALPRFVSYTYGQASPTDDKIAQREDIQQATINNAVNFRTAPSLNSGKYGTLQEGTTVKMLEEVNRYWLKVEAKGKVGYISALPRFVNYSECDCEEDAKQVPVETPKNASYKKGKFPFKEGTYRPYRNNFGALRTWSPTGRTKRSHEGIDIAARKGTPLYSATDGRIVSYGWNYYGGWRLGIRTDGYYLYYAHMDKYAPGLYEGATIKKGQLIGYVGKTGYGPPGTEGVGSHLHFGIYRNGSTINPYPYHKSWEQNN
jgi:murein DD-endopeptidase MepM/ murein hydrolase activator NlpD